MLSMVAVSEPSGFLLILKASRSSKGPALRVPCQVPSTLLVAPFGASGSSAKRRGELKNAKASTATMNGFMGSFILVVTCELPNYASLQHIACGLAAKPQAM